MVHKQFTTIRLYLISISKNKKWNETVKVPFIFFFIVPISFLSSSLSFLSRAAAACTTSNCASPPNQASLPPTIQYPRNWGKMARLLLS
jgi:hypothetical protein